MPPSSAFVKIVQSGFLEFDDGPIVDVGIVSIRRRLSDGRDETINFPALDSFDSVQAHFEQNMTNVTFGIKVSRCIGHLMCTIGYWG
jgi:hypothetical protein